MAGSDFDDKERSSHVEDGAPYHESTPTTPRNTMEAPELVKAMSPDDRVKFEKLLLRKIDLRLLPAVIIMYIMNYLDRNNIAAARIAGPDGRGLQDELALTDTQWQLAVSILFVGYILMQVPSNMVLNKIGLPAIYLPTVMIIWGIISGATAGIHSFGGLVAVRFFLGFVEAAYFVSRVVLICQLICADST
jgi:sugar phosphate permease